MAVAGGRRTSRYVGPESGGGARLCSIAIVGFQPELFSGSNWDSCECCGETASKIHCVCCGRISCARNFSAVWRACEAGRLGIRRACDGARLSRGDAGRVRRIATCRGAINGVIEPTLTNRGWGTRHPAEDRQSRTRRTCFISWRSRGVAGLRRLRFARCCCGGSKCRSKRRCHVFGGLRAAPKFRCLGRRRFLRRSELLFR